MQHTQIACAYCARAFRAMQPRHILAAAQPHYKQLLLSARLFQYECPACGRQNESIHPLFYEDSMRKLAICMQPEEERAELFFPEAVALHKKGYALRLVSAPEALLEKVRIWEEGLHDKVLELWKLENFYRLERSFPGRGINALYFTPRQEEKYISFDAYAGGRRLSRIVLHRAEYMERLAVLAPIAGAQERPGRYLRIDMGWAGGKAARHLRRALLGSIPELVDNPVFQP